MSEDLATPAAVASAGLLKDQKDLGAAQNYARRVGTLIRDARKNRGWTQAQLAETLGTTQSAIARIEQGNQNLTLELLARIGEALESEIVTLGRSGPTHLRVDGGTPAAAAIDGQVQQERRRRPALRLAAQRGRTTLRNVARIVEVRPDPRGAAPASASATRWDDGNDLELVPPAELDLAGIDAEAARRTRSIIMFLGPLLHRASSSSCPTPAAATSAPAPSSRT